MKSSYDAQFTSGLDHTHPSSPSAILNPLTATPQAHPTTWRFQILN